MDFAAFKVAMQDWAVGGAHKFTTRYQSPDATRNVVISAQQGRPFCACATFNKALGHVKVAIDKTTPSQIRDAVKLHHQVAISYVAAREAKKDLLGNDLEAQAAQFQLLPAYTDAIRSADPNARVVLSIENQEGI